MEETSPLTSQPDEEVWAFRPRLIPFFQDVTKPKPLHSRHYIRPRSWHSLYSDNPNESFVELAAPVAKAEGEKDPQPAEGEHPSQDTGDVDTQKGKETDTFEPKPTKQPPDGRKLAADAFDDDVGLSFVFKRDIMTNDKIPLRRRVLLVQWLILLSSS